MKRNQFLFTHTVCTCTACMSKTWKGHVLQIFCFCAFVKITPQNAIAHILQTSAQFLFNVHAFHFYRNCMWSRLMNLIMHFNISFPCFCENNTVECNCTLYCKQVRNFYSIFSVFSSYLHHTMCYGQKQHYDIDPQSLLNTLVLVT